MENAPFRRGIAAIALAAMLSACGGGGGGTSVVGGSGSGGPIGMTPTPTPAATPTPTPAASCTLGARQDWVLRQMREWYLFPETLPASPDPASYSNVDDFLDALTATARGQGRDRFFTHVTSIAAENAFYQSGQSAGFGIRLISDGVSRLFVSESYEGAPALASGIDRGAEIVGIGTSAATIRTVASIVQSEGGAGVIAALGPDTTGTARVLRIRDANGTRDVTLTKRDYDIEPVSSRTGVRIIDGPDGKVGYVALRTFIDPAAPALRSAFARFKSEGVRDLIVDFRYNGGGSQTIAQLLGDLLSADRTRADVFGRVAFRPEKASNNEILNFTPQPESIAPRRIAFIGTEQTASASELVINALLPYYGSDIALIGTNTFGKPVGQIGLDRAACDDRLRVVAVSFRNRDNQGDYYSGLASSMRATCSATDDLSRPMGDAAEASTRVALDYLAGRSCTPIGGVAGAVGQRTAQRSSVALSGRRLLTPDRPTPAQREVPGTF